MQKMAIPVTVEDIMNKAYILNPSATNQRKAHKL
jgi:hypothetical protein